MMNNDSPKLNSVERTLVTIIQDKFWIARDQDGELYIYFKEPVRMRTHWITDYCALRKLEDTLFPFITWESCKAWNSNELKQLKFNRGKGNVR